MKSIIKHIVLFLSLLLLIIIISLSPELLGEPMELFLKNIIGEKYYLTVIIISSLIALLFYTFWSEKDKIFIKKSYASKEKVTIDKSLAEVRLSFIESYQNRLNSKMAARLPINLQLKYSLEGSNEKVVLYNNKANKTKPLGDDLITIFNQHHGRLLIIGEPGSGKTSLLLQLALSLFEKENTLIPIVINIATWQERFSSISDWFNELLPQMGLSKSFAQYLIQKNKILPLFDGLDELTVENRKQCLEAIGMYGKTSAVQYIICSRIVEYSETVDAPVYCQIEVLPLTLKQIKDQLKKANTPEANGMLDAIIKDKLLAEAVKTPFYFNTVQLLFSSFKIINEFDFISLEIDGRKKEIVTFFIKETLSFISVSLESSTRWLSFLAHEMKKHHLVNFELINLQYSWSNWSKNTLRIALVLDVLVRIPVIFLNLALLFGIFFALPLSIGASLENESMVVGLLGALVMGILLSLVISVLIFLYRILIRCLYFKNYDYNSLIYTKDTIKWSAKTFIVIFREYFLLVQIVTFVGLFGKLLYIEIIDNENLDIFNNPSESLPSFLIFCVVYGLIIGVGWSLFIGILFSFDYNSYSFLKVKSPYQRFKASAKNLHFSILQNFILRYQLYKKDLLPIRLVSFLNKLTQHHLFESDGASWRFRHQILQDHFAELWEENPSDKS